MLAQEFDSLLLVENVFLQSLVDFCSVNDPDITASLVHILPP